jgi:flagellar hook-basal body complex protein FliE
MASILESIINMLGQQNLGRISKQVQAPEDKTQKAITDISALLTGALANNASKQQGAQALANALDKDHDGSILDDLPDYINNYQQGPGDGILGHVLGGNRNAVEQGLSKKTGLDIGTISQLLTIAAPIILGALGKKQRQDGLNLNDLTSLLGNEQNQAQKIDPDALNILNQVLGSSGKTQNTQAQSTRRRSPIITIIIVIVIAIVVYFLLRACGIL